MIEARSSKCPPKLPATMTHSRARFFLWGTILLLVAVGLIELLSYRNYDATLKMLQVGRYSIPGGNGAAKIPFKDAGQAIQGFTFQIEEQAGQNRKLTYRWPSVAMNYSLAMVVDAKDQIVRMDTDLANIEHGMSAPHGVATRTPERPTEGLSIADEQTVALGTQEFPESMQLISSGSLGRELIRQSFLIAARDELGLSTIDASLGELTLTHDSPKAFPFQIGVAVSPAEGDAEAVLLQVTVIRADRSDQTFRWTSSRMRVAVKQRVKSLAELGEAISRSEFVDALNMAGIQASAVAPPDLVTAPAEFEGQLDFVSQYAMLRRLHSERRAHGESIENLGGIVRAYANLGDLVDFHWGPASKAFKARSLIYAHRLLSKYGKSPYAYAHLAYAWALTGHHVNALDAIQAARAATGQTAPDWLATIEAFCEYNPKVLEAESGPQQELSFYLRMRQVNPNGDLDAAVDAFQRFTQQNPACCRAVEFLCETNNVGLCRLMTEGGAEAQWPFIFERLARISDLPSAAKKITEKNQDTGHALGEDDEPVDRVEFLKELRSAASATPDRVEPSWNVLAELMSDTLFVQAWRAVHCTDRILGIDPSQHIDQLYPLVKSHRFGEFIKTYSHDRQTSNASLDRIGRSTDSVWFELPCEWVGKKMFDLDRGLYVQIANTTKRHWDLIYDDLVRAKNATISQEANQFGFRLVEACPHQPRAIDWKLAQLPELPINEARALEEKYGDDPEIMLALGNKLRAVFRYSDAERCLRKSIEAKPTYNACLSLAYEYWDRRDFAASQDLFERALTLPSHGLEQAKTQEQLAELLMRQGKFQAAMPYAEAAAQSYAGWGLLIAARCAERLEDWPLAEGYYRAVSERYEDLSGQWYLACVRRGRGDLAHARALADQTWGKLVPPYDANHMMVAFVMNVIDGKLKEAKQALTDPRTKNFQDVFMLLNASLVADSLGETDERDALFSEIEKRTDPNLPIPKIVSLFRRALRDPDHLHWNHFSFEELVSEASREEVTFAYYCVGKFLEIHHEEERAREYLQCAATSYDIEKSSCLLATLYLRERDVPISATRLHAHAESLHPCVELLTESVRAQRENKFDVARSKLNEALKLRPDFVLGLLIRGRLSETEGNYSAAIADYEAALHINPESENAHYNIALLRATCPQDDVRSAAEAMKHALQVFEGRVTKTWFNFSLLAAAEAEAGNFGKAVELQQQAIKLAPNNTDLLNQLKLYQERTPYRISRIN